MRGVIGEDGVSVVGPKLVVDGIVAKAIDSLSEGRFSGSVGVTPLLVQIVPVFFEGFLLRTLSKSKHNRAKAQRSLGDKLQLSGNLLVALHVNKGPFRGIRIGSPVHVGESIRSLLLLLHHPFRICLGTLNDGNETILGKSRFGCVHQVIRKVTKRGSRCQKDKGQKVSSHLDLLLGFAAGSRRRGGGRRVATADRGFLLLLAVRTRGLPGNGIHRGRAIGPGDSRKDGFRCHGDFVSWI
mmetsp:Transcript_1660/g.3874  ORF Transcript_1660/g.3874 Transcript_1660/m.3874 type:complete len:240 (-) Transcript_1660:214-933(-)